MRRAVDTRRDHRGAIRSRRGYVRERRRLLCSRRRQRPQVRRRGPRQSGGRYRRRCEFQRRRARSRCLSLSRAVWLVAKSLICRHSKYASFRSKVTGFLSCHVTIPNWVNQSRCFRAVFGAQSVVSAVALADVGSRDCKIAS